MSRRRRRPVRRSARRWRPWKILAAIAGLVAIIVVVSVAVFLVAPWFDDDSGPRAAIVDQLSLTVPNPAFVDDATATLESDGYAVDYFPGEEATVDFYRDLPTHGYEVIVFRTHAGGVKEVNELGVTVRTTGAALFTT